MRKLAHDQSLVAFKTNGIRLDHIPDRRAGPPAAAKGLARAKGWEGFKGMGPKGNGPTRKGKGLWSPGLVDCCLLQEREKAASAFPVAAETLLRFPLPCQWLASWEPVCRTSRGLLPRSSVPTPVMGVLRLLGLRIERGTSFSFRGCSLPLGRRMSSALNMSIAPCDGTSIHGGRCSVIAAESA